MYSERIDTLTELGHPQIEGFNRDSAGRAVLRMLALRKPIVVAMHGACIGVGTTMTLGADIRIAGEGARFGLPFTRLGLVPEGASTWLLSRIVGMSQALEWIMTGRQFGAAEARDGGLVSRVVPDDEVTSTAMICPEIAALQHQQPCPTPAATVAHAYGRTPWEAHQRGVAAAHPCRRLADARRLPQPSREGALVRHPDTNWLGSPHGLREMDNPVTLLGPISNQSK